MIRAPNWHQLDSYNAKPNSKTHSQTYESHKIQAISIQQDQKQTLDLKKKTKNFKKKQSK